MRRRRRRHLYFGGAYVQLAALGLHNCHGGAGASATGRGHELGLEPAAPLETALVRLAALQSAPVARGVRINGTPRPTGTNCHGGLLVNCGPRHALAHLQAIVVPLLADCVAIVALLARLRPRRLHLDHSLTGPGRHWSHILELINCGGYRRRLLRCCSL